MQRTFRRGVWGLVLMLACTACGPKTARQDGMPRTRPFEDSTRSARLDHVTPARDSMGRMPTKFEWTAVAGADEYSIGVWNEVDMLLWRMNHIPGNSIVVPDDFTLEPGTYLWTVSALRNGEQIAESGLAAFVVRAPQQ